MFLVIAQSIAKRSLGALLKQPDINLQDMKFWVISDTFRTQESCFRPNPERSGAG